MSQSSISNPVALDRGTPRAGGVFGAVDAVLTAFAAQFNRTGPRAAGIARYEWPMLLLVLAVATFVRFYGLGGVGLHGDEETMAMPTLHLLADGQPLLPSGMFYPRAMAQLYLMAGSVSLFGHDEWALRLPSALCGIALVLVAFFAGRRFLSSPWNLAFAATVALLPDFIVASQTARMYVFFVTSVTVFLLLLFKWERTDRAGYLIGAVLALLVGLQFHTLTIFSAPLLLYPGLVQGDRKKVLLGIVAFITVAASFVAIDWWIGTAYPQTADIEGAEPLRNGAKAASAVPQFTPLLLAAAALAAAAVVAWVVRGISRRGTSIFVGVLLAAGLVSQMLFGYHLAAMLIVAGLIAAERSGRIPRGRLLTLGVVCALIAAAQIWLLHSNGVESFRLMIGAMTGWPSVWPALVMTHYSPIAALILATGIVAALWQLARRRPLPDFILLVALGVWLPLVLIGMFKWWIPTRYLDGQSMLLLLGAFAAAQWLCSGGWFARARASARFGVAVQSIAAVAVCALVLNPAAVARSINPGYSTNPDHKGAAEYIRSLQLQPNDILVAEDVLQMTYYLGHVSYWLSPKDVASQFVHDVDGKVLEFYTNTPVITSGDELQALLARPGRGTVYVIGSGEDQVNDRAFMRRYGIAEVLASPQLDVVFRGRDGTTKIWRGLPPGSDGASREGAQRATR